MNDDWRDNNGRGSTTFHTDFFHIEREKHLENVIQKLKEDHNQNIEKVALEIDQLAMYFTVSAAKIRSMKHKDIK